MDGKLNGNLREEALWQCDNCFAWWCSQPEVRPTRFMLEFPVEVLNGLGWDNFRGWRLGGTPHVGTCPDCTTEMSEPRYGKAFPGAQLQGSLTALLTPARAPAG